MLDARVSREKLTLHDLSLSYGSCLDSNSRLGPRYTSIYGSYVLQHTDLKTAESGVNIDFTEHCDTCNCFNGIT